MKDMEKELSMIAEYGERQEGVVGRKKWKVTIA